MLQKLHELSVGRFFRIYSGSNLPVSKCIFRICEYDKLRDIYICNSYSPCGKVDCVLLRGNIDVYPV